MASAARMSAAQRSWSSTAAQPGWAFTAVSTAAATSPGVPNATHPITSPVAGSLISVPWSALTRASRAARSSMGASSGDILIVTL